MHSIWKPDLTPRQGPVAAALADAIADAIQSGQLRPGERLPPHRDLADALGRNVTTISRGYAEAQRRGLVTGEVGRGTFVRAPAFGAVNRGSDEYAVDLSVNTLLPLAHAQELVSRFGAIAGQLLADRLMGYQPSGGRPEIRVAGTAWVRRTGLNAVPERIVVTAGAQQGLAAVCSVVCAPGDEILTDGVTYPGIKAVANHLHLTLRAVEGDGEGIRPEALAGVARRGRARLLYCMPTLQNPLGVVASIRRRQALAAVVQQTDLHVIEDDVYGFLASSPPRFCSILPERTFHITSLSKSVAPGLRVGFVVAPPRWIEPITAAVYATTIMAPPSGAEVAAAWIADGTADRIVDWKRSEIAARSKIAARLLTGVHARVVLNCPHVWLPLPGHWSPDTFLRALQRQGILITGAQDFAVTRQVPNAVRLCLGAAPDRRTLAGALGTIRDLMRKRNTVIRTVV